MKWGLGRIIVGPICVGNRLNKKNVILSLTHGMLFCISFCFSWCRVSFIFYQDKYFFFIFQFIFLKGKYLKEKINKFASLSYFGQRLWFLKSSFMLIFRGV